MTVEMGLCKFFVTAAPLAFAPRGAMILRTRPSRYFMDTNTPTAAPAAVPTPAVDRMPAGNRGLLLIAVFEVLKAVLFLVAAAGVFHMVKRDTQVEMIKLLHAFRISGDRAFIKSLLLRANVITDPTKRILSGVLLLYAVLHATEGIGLLLRKRWAEYITVIMTGIFIPYELFILIHHTAHSKAATIAPAEQQIPALFSQHIIVLKIAVLIGNVAIVWFLIYHLRRSGRHGAGHPLPPNGQDTATPL